MAVFRFRHFAKAAEYCGVTQPTLSSMVQKLEDELGLKIFDRKRTIGRGASMESVAACTKAQRNGGRGETFALWNLHHRHLAHHRTLSYSTFLPPTDEQIS